jgi:glycerate-2-kinase
METKDVLIRIFKEALRAVDPSLIVKKHAMQVQTDFEKDNLKNLYVIGFGKAAYQMAMSVEEVFPPKLITDGIIVTKYGHAGIQNTEHRAQSTDLNKIKVYEAAHPIPDKNGIRAAEEIVKMLRDTNEETLVLCLISGGGSALFVLPCEGVTLREKQAVTDLLLNAGADITELNCVRKHLSKVKGGRLAEITYPARIISLIISDVIGDKLDIIASGPTSPDSSTYQDALGVLSKYDLIEKVPTGVLDVLARGKNGLMPETPKADSPVFDKVKNIIIGSNQIAIEAARREAEEEGFETEVVSTDITGEAREVGQWLAKKALEIKRNKDIRCLISGGETTVTVKGKGKGGRNTELALSFAMEIEGVEGITLLSAGTDGTDGPTDAAGAIVNGQTVIKAKGRDLDPQKYLNNNDSYNFFRQIDSLLITGPTGTNVMDLQIVIIE